MKMIDFNCDLGEIEGGESLAAAILPVITSANVACGYHAGGAKEMLSTVRLAKAAGTAVGAHPGFPDRANFGRTKMDLPPEEIRAHVLYQLGALSAFCRAEGVPMVHVKPHGALYNMAARDRALADAICDAVAAFDDKLILVGLSGSLMADAAAAKGLRFASEVFADRAYMPDGSLMPRTQEGAVISDLDKVKAQVLRFATAGEVVAADGSVIPVKADTLCLHGDNPAAIAAAAEIRRALESAGVAITPMEELAL